MLSYIIRRLLLIVPTLLGMTAVVFFTMALSPGGVGGALLNQQGTMKADVARAMREYYDKRYGLNKPPIVQYFRWLNMVSPVGREVKADGALGRLKFKAPDLGESFSKGRPVIDLFAEALPITLLLNLLTIPIIYSIAIFSGIRAAKSQNGAFDVFSGGTFLVLYSIPTIWAGVLLIGFLCNRQYFHFFPTSGLHDTLADTMPFLPHLGPRGFQRGWLLDTCWHLVLPVVCLTYAGFAFLSKLTRGAVLDSMAADYARTALAKGLSRRVVLYRHVVRNSLIPLITVAASILPGLMGGALITETIFSIHGMGLLMIEAINARDRELVLAEALVIGLVGLVSYLLADILYAVADPRVSYD